MNFKERNKSKVDAIIDEEEIMKKGNREKNKVEENNVTITHKTEAEKFSSYFQTIVENLNLLYKV